MAEYYAKTYKKIYFATMHPGWADTPGIYKMRVSFILSTLGLIQL